MAYEFDCKTAGHHGCGWKVTANSEDELMSRLAEHVQKKHKVAAPLRHHRQLRPPEHSASVKQVRSQRPLLAASFTFRLVQVDGEWLIDGGA